MQCHVLYILLTDDSLKLMLDLHGCLHLVLQCLYGPRVHTETALLLPDVSLQTLDQARLIFELRPITLNLPLHLLPLACHLVQPEEFLLLLVGLTVLPRGSTTSRPLMRDPSTFRFLILKIFM